MLFPNSLKLLLLNSNLFYFSWSLLSNYSEQHRHKFDTNKEHHSYSQTGEDTLCKKYLPESFGNYIDVGCGQPIHGSNTYFLYRSGWEGVAIDPILNNKRLFKYLRPRDTFKRILIGKKDQKVLFMKLFLMSTPQQVVNL